MSKSIDNSFLLSSWIFYWAVVYCAAKYVMQISDEHLEWWDPTFALLFAIIYQIYVLFQILFRILVLKDKSSDINKLPRILLKFALLTIFFKLLPLYLVVGGPLFKMSNKIMNRITNESVASFAVAFLLYFVYITQKQMDLFDIYDDVIDSYVADDNRLQFYRRLRFLDALII